MIKHQSYCNGQPKLRGFFLLDDGRTYVMAWNSTGEFIMYPGRLQGWCIDEKTHALRPMEPKDLSSRTAKVIEGVSVAGSSGDTSVGWIESRNASIATVAYGCGHTCTSCNTSKAASTFTAKSKNSTAHTTPGSPTGGAYDSEGDEVSAKELRDKLTELWENQPRVVSP